MNLKGIVKDFGNNIDEIKLRLKYGPVRKRKKIFPMILLLIIIGLGYTALLNSALIKDNMSGMITGFAILSVKNTVDTNITFEDEDNFSMTLDEYTKGIMLSGKLEGVGEARIFLHHRGKDYTIVERTLGRRVYETASETAYGSASETIVDETIRLYDECKESCNFNLSTKNVELRAEIDPGIRVDITELSYIVSDKIEIEKIKDFSDMESTVRVLSIEIADAARPGIGLSGPGLSGTGTA